MGVHALEQGDVGSHLRDAGHVYHHHFVRVGELLLVEPAPQGLWVLGRHYDVLLHLSGLVNRRSDSSCVLSHGYGCRSTAVARRTRR